MAVVDAARMFVATVFPTIAFIAVVDAAIAFIPGTDPCRKPIASDLPTRVAMTGPFAAIATASAKFAGFTPA